MKWTQIFPALFVDFCLQSLTFATNQRVIESVVGSAPVEHPPPPLFQQDAMTSLNLHINLTWTWVGVTVLFLFTISCTLLSSIQRSCGVPVPPLCTSTTAHITGTPVRPHIPYTVNCRKHTRIVRQTVELHSYLQFTGVHLGSKGSLEFSRESIHHFESVINLKQNHNFEL